VKRAVLIRPGGNTEPLMIHEPTELEQLQAAVGGYIQMVPTSINLTAFCNEDGKSKGLPYNDLAQAVFGGLLTPYDHLVGNVVVMGPVDEEGETLGLTPAQVDIFLTDKDDLLNKLIQVRNSATL
jgi:hypothetical protein